MGNCGVQAPCGLSGVLRTIFGMTISHQVDPGNQEPFLIIAKESSDHVQDVRAAAVEIERIHFVFLNCQFSHNAA